MAFANTYLTLGVAVDGRFLVARNHLAGCTRPVTASFALADLNALDAADAATFAGILTLGLISMRSPVLERHPYCQLVLNLRWTGRRVGAIHGDTDPPRTMQLRICLASEPERLLIQRCTQATAADITLHELLLARLLLSGQDAAARTIGATVLRELAALHPDAFAPYAVSGG